MNFIKGLILGALPTFMFMVVLVALYVFSISFKCCWC